MGDLGTILGAGRRQLAHGAHSGAARDASAHVAQLRTLLREGDAAAGALLPTSGNRFELFDDAESFIGRLVEDIRGARQQVNLTTYALHPGRPGGLVSRVTDALVERAGAGVPVTVIVDQVGGGLLFPGTKRTARRAFVDQLRRAGVDVEVKRLTLGRGGVGDYRLAVDHRKLYEIDGRVSWQGGMNLVDAWLPWHDAMMRVEGPASAQAGALLAARWRDLGRTVPEARAAVLEAALRAPLDDARHATLQLTNGNRVRRQLTDRFIADARGATQRLWVANPYLGDPRVMQPIVDAARAGRDVRLLLSPKALSAQSQDAFTDPLRRAWAYEVAKAGGAVTVLPEFSHAKAWISDDAAAVGSFNLDLSATKRNYENAIRTTDPQAVAAVEALFAGQERRGALAATSVVEEWRSVANLRQRLGLRY